MKGFRCRLLRDLCGDHARDMAPHLLCGRCKTRHRTAIGTHNRCNVADHEDVWLSRDAQIRFDLQPSGVVAFDAQPPGGIVDRLEAGGMFCPFVAAKIAVLCTGRDDQVVERQCISLGKRDAPSIGVDRLASALVV